MSTAKTKQKITTLAQQILEQAAIENAAKEIKEKLKADLSQLCEDNKTLFEEGKLKIEDANVLVQEVLNPPKAIFIKSEEPLKPEDRHEVAQRLGNQYIKLDIDFKKIQSRIDSDKELKKALKTAGVSIIQETRYDVKRLTK